LAANQTLKGIAQPHAEVPEGSSSVTAESAKLVGQADTHLCSPTEVERLGVPVHEDVVEPFMELRAAAATEGFDVAIHSGFRSFDRQLSIWNRKADGQLAVLDSSARPIDITTLSERELVFAILRWSALPGASRHHWGTDLDVFDAGGMPDGYQVELIPSEYERGGVPLRHRCIPVPGALGRLRSGRDHFLPDVLPLDGRRLLGDVRERRL
jgi:LAS superfamily LD-carboxypeptidase LdcB